MMDRLFANTVASAEASRLLADIKAIETQHVAAAITQMAASVSEVSGYASAVSKATILADAEVESARNIHEDRWLNA